MLPILASASNSPRSRADLSSPPFATTSLLFPSAFPRPPLRELPDASIRVAIDRGGTFTDVWASFPDLTGQSEAADGRKEIVVKLRELSSLSLTRSFLPSPFSDYSQPTQSPSTLPTTVMLPSRGSVESSRSQQASLTLEDRSSISPSSSTPGCQRPWLPTVCSSGRARRSRCLSLKALR